MGFTSSIEQRLDHIQQDIAHGFNPDQGQVYLSAADAHWLILLAKNAAKRDPVLTIKQLKISRFVFYLFLSSLGILSLTGIIWGITAIIKLI